MKKIGLLVVILILCSCKTSIPFNYNLQYLNEYVVSADVVLVTNGRNDIIEYDKINEIVGEDYSSMLEDLSKINFIQTLGRPQIASGYCFKLYLSNDFELVCANIVIKCDYTNKHISHKDIYTPKNFDQFISNYLRE